ncbi:MAG: SDR family NAD(P)-dependent oxidoreductase [Micrococcaceae bacterium]
MDLGLTERTAIVTGASSGIGRAIALGLAREGVSVAVVGRNADQLAEVGAEARQGGAPRVAVLAQDLADDESARLIAERASAELGDIHILVNSAGGSVDVDVETEDEVWSRAMTVNWERHRQLVGQVLSSMRAAGWGRIINITGTSEARGMNATVVAKSAVHAWSKGLVDLVARDGVTVNCIAPGRIESAQMRRLYTPERQAAVAAEKIPAGRFGTPDEVADLAVFLASPRASYLNGVVIHADGGARRFLY